MAASSNNVPSPSAVTSSTVSVTAPELTLAASPVAASTGPRLTTLEPRHHGATDISLESALDNTGKIVANLLANKKQVVLKERTAAPCYVML